MVDHKIASFGDEDSTWNVGPDELKRQAIASLRGYIYQLHASVAAWIRLPSQGRLYLEVAEDYAEVLRAPGSLDDILRACQVKDTRESGAVTLNSPDVQEAIEHLFSLRKSNPGRPVHLTFLTTSPVGSERIDSLPNGVAALHAWKTASDGGEMDNLVAALKKRFTVGPLAEFLRESTHDEIRNYVIRPLDFACGQPDWQQVERASREYLVSIRSKANATLASASDAYDTLFGFVLKTVLQSPTRELTAEQFELEFARATAIPMPSQVLTDLVSAAAAPQRTTEVLTLERSALAQLASTLLNLGKPPSILKHFPEADETIARALNTLDQVPRWLVEQPAPGKDTRPVKLRIEDLLSQPKHPHLFYAVPGAGKTHALWTFADSLLRKTSQSWLASHVNARDGNLPDLVDAKVPLLLSIGGLNSAEEALAPIRTVVHDREPSEVVHDPRVVILLDGWTEFAIGEHFAERSKLLASLAGGYVIACARYSDASDTIFRCWSLELLSPDVVERTVSHALPNSSRVNDRLAEMIRLPLVLSLFLLLGGSASSPGELLSRFHRYVAKRLPETFEGALADAVSSLTSSRERNYSKLIAALKRAAALRNVPEPIELLMKLGTITERGKNALPVHDLYWSWLTGVGILRESRTEDAILLLSTRESYDLALQSDEAPDPALIAQTASRDAVLAASFDASLRSSTIDNVLANQLDEMFTHQALAVRCRAAVAGLRSRRSNYVRQALLVIDELSAARVYVPDLQNALDPASLFLNRADLAAWVGSPGTSVVMDAVATRGNGAWLPWLKKMYSDGRLEPRIAVGVALACSGRVPQWCAELLIDLLTAEPWLLRFTSERRANVELAMWLANHYAEVMTPKTPGWWHVNQVLLSCGNDEVFERLLALFPDMALQAQEYLGYAIASLGDPWLAKFQRLAFSSPGATHLHALQDHVSSQIDEETARQWIAVGYYECGWRVLIEKRGSAVLPELIRQLPATFDGAAEIPALEVMQHLRDAPETLVQELISRNRGQMSAIVGQSIIFAASRAKNAGIFWLVNLATMEPPVFSGYHAKLVLKAYVEWASETGLQLGVDTPLAKGIPFANWYVAARFLRDWSDSMSPEAFALVPEMAIPTVVLGLLGDDEKAKRILERQPPLSSFDGHLFERMIGSKALAPLTAKIFANVFDSFPAAELERFVRSPFVKQDEVEYALRSASNPDFKAVHHILIERVLSAPTDIQRIRSVANMLRSYSREEVVEILRGLPQRDGQFAEDNEHWLCRETGVARGELLIDEAGNLLDEGVN